MILSGIRLIYSKNAMAESSEPKKKHAKKPWMRESYHKRIQKKWLKRFGRALKPCYYISNNGVLGQVVIAHPSLKPEIEKLFKSPINFIDWRGYEVKRVS